MAQLTWRNVNSPDFGTAIEGYRAMGSLLNNATSNLQNGLAGFQQAQQQQADKQLLAQALQYTNPEEYQAALASGALMRGVNPNDVSAGTLKDLSGRVNTLLGQASAAQQLKTDQYQFGRKTADDARLDAAQPDIARMLLANSSGDLAGASAIAQNSPALAGLTPQQLNTVLTQGSGLTTNNIGNRRESWNLGNTIKNANEQELVQNTIQEIRDGSFTATGAARFLDGRTDLPPRLRAAVERGLEPVFGRLSGPGNAADVANAPVTATGDPYDTILGNGQFGTPTKPVSQMSIGEALDFGKNTLIPNTRNNAQLGLANTGKGSSALGAFQITNETLQNYGPKVFGKDWQNTKLTGENQDKLAEQIFEDNKGGNLKKIWSSLPNSADGAYKDRSWADMKAEIVQRETGRTLRQTAKDINTSNAEIQANVGQRSGQNAELTAANAIANAASDETPREGVVGKLVGKGGAFEGGEVGKVQKYLDDIISASAVDGKRPMRPSQAAVILERASRGDGGSGLGNDIMRAARNYLPGISQDSFNMDIAVSPGRILNRDSIRNDIGLYTGGKVVDRVLKNQATKDAAASVQSAKDSWNTEASTLATYQARVANTSGPRRAGLMLELANQQARVDAAKKLYDDTLRAAQNDPDLRPLKN